MNKTQAQGGFTIIQLLVVMSVGLILAAGAGRGLITKLNQKRTDLVASQIQTLMDASISYLEINEEWPDQDNNCVAPVDVLVGDEYIAGVDAATAWARPGSGGATEGHLTFACDSANPRIYSMAVTLPDAKWAKQLAGSLVNATLAGRTVTVFGTRTSVLASMAGHTIRDAMIIDNDDSVVDKPDCTFGYEPTIFSAYTGFSASEDVPVIGAAYIRLVSETSDTWTIKGEITSTQSTDRPSGSRMQMMVFTMCQPS